MDGHAEACSHAIAHLSNRVEPAFLLSITMTVVPGEAAVSYQGIGEILLWQLTVTRTAASKQLANQHCIDFMDALCSRKLYGPVPFEEEPATFHWLFRRYMPGDAKYQE